jgi:hypothetical protein
MRAIFDNPFEAKGRWFKGNLHTHTLNSDGLLSVEQQVTRYQEAGYDFLSITDHGKLTDTKKFSTPSFLLIPGEEICVGSSEAGNFIHIVGINVRGEIPVDDFDREGDPQKVIDLIRELGGVAWIAHPYWSGLNLNDVEGLTGHLGVEVYNTTCDLHINRGFSNVHWDNLLVSGKRVFGFAVDDAHNEERKHLPSDSCWAWINVKAESLTVDDIMKSVRKGLFYSSTGPEIKNLEIGEGEISVSTSPVKTISFVSNAGLGEKNTAEIGNLKKAVYHLRGGESYVRIEASDRSGRTAWSNPIFIEP